MPLKKKSCGAFECWFKAHKSLRKVLKASTSPVLMDVCVERFLLGTSAGKLFPIREGSGTPELIHKHINTHTHTHTQLNTMHVGLDLSFKGILCGNMNHLSITRLQRVRCPLNADWIIVREAASSSPSTAEGVTSPRSVASTAWEDEIRKRRSRKKQGYMRNMRS